MLTTVEKVLFLQDVDIFKNTLTADLAHIAAITDEVEIAKDNTVFKEGDMANSMYLVIKGMVQLERDGNVVMTAQPKEAFGTWALFDDEPRVVTALTLEDTKLLKIEKENFFELLADHVQITQGLFKTMVKRLRTIMARIGA